MKLPQSLTESTETQKMNTENILIAFISVTSVLLVQFLSSKIRLEHVKRVLAWIGQYIPSFTLSTEMKKILFVFALILAGHYYQTLSAEKHPFDIIEVPQKSILSKQTLDDWGDQLVKPTKVSYDINLKDEEQRRKARALMDHMYRRCPANHAFCIASEFGSDGRIMLMHKDLFVVNPVITYHSDEAKEIDCYGSKIPFSVMVIVEYYDYELVVPTKKTFLNKQALYIQCAFLIFKLGQ